MNPLMLKFALGCLLVACQAAPPTSEGTTPIPEEGSPLSPALALSQLSDLDPSTAAPG